MYKKEAGTDLLVFSMLCQSKMLQFSVLLLVSFLTVSCGQNHTACKKLCITASDRRLEGFDSVLSPIYVDIPRCAVIYDNVSCYYVIHPPETECQPSCLPSSSKVLTEQLRTGPKNYKIVESCHFHEGSCKHCKRRSYKIKYFEFSKYQTEVDVGRCTGQCTDSEGSGSSPGLCVPVRNTTASIPGPNGVTTVSVIDECSCEPSCYRFSHHEAFLERRENSRPEIMEKVIDVGKCVGRCTKMLPGRCVSYDYYHKRCMIRLPPRWSVCRPTSGDTVSFTRVDGENVTIPIIKECGCSYG